MDQTTCLIDISASSIQKEEPSCLFFKLRSFWLDSWESKGAGTPKCQKSPALFEGIFFRDLYENHAASAGGQGRGHYHHGCWCRRGGFLKGEGGNAQGELVWMWEEIPILSSLAEKGAIFFRGLLERPSQFFSSYPWSCFIVFSMFFVLEMVLVISVALPGDSPGTADYRRVWLLCPWSPKTVQMKRRRSGDGRWS